jgi:hypothetical protein
MNKSKKIVWTIVSIIVLVGVFFGGAAYGKGSTNKTAATGAGAFAGRARGAGGAGFGGSFGSLTTGQIISKDATSITVQLAGGGAAGSAVGSKIIFLASDTKITKTTTGTLADLAVGTDVSVAGAANADGSMNATTIMIRPNVPASAPAAPVVQ